MFSKNSIEKFQQLETPFYYYNTDLLTENLQKIKKERLKHGYKVHYALKANANKRVLQLISAQGFGADCVSGNEVVAAIENGFPAYEVVYAGVGKSDKEIKMALQYDIFCFNCESVQEIEVINQLAAEANKVARIAIRLNPNIDAKTHQYITTGLVDNKFGINPWDFDRVLEVFQESKNIELIGLHFHVGSQITDYEVFRLLCDKVNEFQDWFNIRGMYFKVLNVGGGLGIDYVNPDDKSVPDFEKFFGIFAEHLTLQYGQELHFELGRSLVAQCSALITRVLFVKNGSKTDFAIVDAGMTELLRPALYQAVHKIENLTSEGEEKLYDVVGPICESSDTFAKGLLLPQTQRGDLIAIRSAGAYGETMASRYNLRDLVGSVFSDSL